MIREGWTADKIIQRALTSDQSDLGLSFDEASIGMDLIIKSGREDDQALEAYDLLHTRANHRRAF
jgi:hypothetical protein